MRWKKKPQPFSILIPTIIYFLDLDWGGSVSALRRLATTNKRKDIHKYPVHFLELFDKTKENEHYETSP